MSASANARTLYKRYLDVISRWPLDPNKSTRDLGVHIRGRLTEIFPKAELTPIEAGRVDTIRAEIEALERLTESVRKKQYRYEYCTATGLTLDQLQVATNSETVTRLNDLYDSGVWNTIKFRFFSMFRG